MTIPLFYEKKLEMKRDVAEKKLSEALCENAVLKTRIEELEKERDRVIAKLDRVMGTITRYLKLTPTEFIAEMEQLEGK